MHTFKSKLWFHHNQMNLFFLIFRPVGMPRMEKVIVQNNDPKNNLHLSYISGSTVHFHCSFFQDKVSNFLFPISTLLN